MAQGEGFKHITVTAPEDDDVVIVAGAVEPVDSVEPDEPAETASETHDEPEEDKVPVKQPVRNTSSKKSDDYHETTLQDLESTPMPFAQRVVIIAAIVCIIGAVIYCLAFMR